MQICFTSHTGASEVIFVHFTHALCFQIAPHGHSEFLHGSIRKSASQERQRLITFIFVNMIQHPCILKNKIYHLSKWQPQPFFDQDTSPVLGNFLVYPFEKTHALVVTVELIRFLFLNTLSLNFTQTLNKSLRFRKFRKSYVQRSVVVQTNHFKPTLLFLLDVRCSKWPHSCFSLRLFVPNDGVFA